MPERNRVGFVYSRLIPRARSVIPALVEALDLGDRAWVSSADDGEIDAALLPETSMIVTAGGDGTIIRVNRIAAPHAVPIVGINLGRVGFMAELSEQEAAERLPIYLNGEARIERRLMIQAEIRDSASGRPRLVAHALNESIVRGALPRLLDIRVSIDGAAMATYRADGVIVSTPTGSTGYALSAGGPVIHPEARALLIQPLAAHISLQSGLVVPDASTIELTVTGGGEAMISVDNLTNATLRDGETVVIAKSPHTARFLRARPPSAFYASLTRRLGVRDRTS